MYCILLAGSFIILVGILFLLLGLFVIKRECPLQWTGMLDRCLYVSTHNASWSSVRQFCNDQGGHMVDIHNEEENNELKGKISSATWIGLYRPPRESQLKWTTNAPITYYSGNRPGTANNDFTQCVKMETSGFWNVESDCTQEFRVVCEYKKSYYPFVLIGPVLIVCGVIVLLLSIEVCQRHRETLRKEGLLDQEEIPNQDEEKDQPGMTYPPNPGISTFSWRRLSSKTAPGPQTITGTESGTAQTSGVAKEAQGVLPDDPGDAETSKLGDKLLSLPGSASQTSGVARGAQVILPDDPGDAETSKLGVKLLSSPESAVSSSSKSQEQLELLLSPKNLR